MSAELLRIMMEKSKVEGGKDLEGRLTAVEWWGHVLEVLVNFNGSWSQHIEVPEGEKEIPTVKVPEVVAGGCGLAGSLVDSGWG